MVEATALPPDAVAEAVFTIYDYIWITLCGVTVLLVALATFYVREMRDGQNEMKEEQKETNSLLVALKVDYTETRTTLADHINNKEIHCQGYPCKYLSDRRVPESG